MTLPSLNEHGDLPVDIHKATLAEVIERFGQGTQQRRVVTQRLVHIYNLAQSTGYVDEFLVFGSYVSDKPEPGDVDIVLIMNDDFDVTTCEPPVDVLFDHLETEVRLGASIFWIRPSLLFLESLQDFKLGWQLKRDGTRRGIVEITNDSK